MFICIYLLNVLAAGGEVEMLWYCCGQVGAELKLLAEKKVCSRYSNRQRL